MVPDQAQDVSGKVEFQDVFGTFGMSAGHLDVLVTLGMGTGKEEYVCLWERRVSGSPGSI
jgi:hypothetical protein